MIVILTILKKRIILVKLYRRPLIQTVIVDSYNLLC